MTETLRILLVEDDPQQRQLIAAILEQEGHCVEACDGVESAVLALKSTGFDAVFSDWKLGERSGIDLLRHVRAHHGELGFAIATAYGTITHAVEAMDAGADDYLAKPFQRQELLLCIDKIAAATQLRSQNRRLTEALSEQEQLVDLVGSAPGMQAVFDRITRIAGTDATVLIDGESGTGKELAARALHRLSPRSQSAFVAVNCGAIPESLAEGELFGAVKGAYTGANTNKTGKLQSAEGGTLFLDEIGELPLALQAKLLRFLQEGTLTPLGSNQELQLDVRVLAATHRNLARMVEDGEFREDLFYRLNIVPVTMPPLRQRREDIPRLIEFFIHKNCQRYQLQAPRIDPDIMRQLIDYAWPGNVRELSNCIERFVLLGDQGELVDNLRQPASTSSALFAIPEQGMDWEAFEKSCLQQALERCDGNRTRAAKLLSMSYKAFLYRLDKHGVV